ncbi:host attachment protein [Actibacterium sp. MT2.3-13A]|uniref:host attachment protein n=1 Tax=Actibacterium sp. MT2.3-13A TaxID=2828332 RepID=UPI001BAE2B69|nr:host attachment protein [Actibacterium sp. MT2.3-13A]
MKSVRTMVIIANDGVARFLENTGNGEGLQEVKVIKEAPEEGYSDFPGRSQASSGTARHKFERPTSEEEHARNLFAAEIVKTAAKLWADNSYNRLLMAAPPKMLGVLRVRLEAPLDDALSGDLDKDLTHVSVHDLPGHFADLAML